MQRFFSKQYLLPVHALVLLGPTGVGKSPLGNIMSQEGLFNRRCHHLDFGSELRDALSREDRSHAYSPTELAFIHGVLEGGRLLENEHFPLAQKIIILFLERVGFSQDDILILNGIPRHEGQARDLDRIAAVHGVILLDCSADDVVCRIGNNVGGDRSERVDDTAELIEKKIAIFRERTAPLIDYYKKSGGKIYFLTVRGTTTPEESFKNFLLLAAVDPPIAFVTKPPQR